MWCALFDYVIPLSGSDGADAGRETRLVIVVVAYACVERARCFWKWCVEYVVSVICFMKLIFFSVPQSSDELDCVNVLLCALRGHVYV